MNFKVLDFYADWCKPCQMISGEIEKLDKEYQDLIKKIDISDTEDELVSTYNVRNIPTLVFIRNNEEVFRHIGSITANVLKEKIDRFKEEIEPLNYKK